MVCGREKGKGKDAIKYKYVYAQKYHRNFMLRKKVGGVFYVVK